MKYELINYNKLPRISDEELLADLRKIADANGGNVTRSIYDESGGFASANFRKRFGSWNEALKRAGLAPFLGNKLVSENELLDDLRRAAALFDGKITFEQYETIGKFSIATFSRRFGAWNKALKIAGLEVNISRNLTEDELFENLEEVWLKLGRQPKSKEMLSPLSKFHADTYSNRFGSWTKALEKFVDVANGAASDPAIEVATASESQIDQEEISIQSRNDHANYAQPKRTNRDPNLRLRWLVYKRDNFRCISCGRSPAKDPNIELHVDHVIPWSKGGETVLNNLQLLCADCNLGKSNIE